jgi:hypothetical protein
MFEGSMRLFLISALDGGSWGWVTFRCGFSVKFIGNLEAVTVRGISGEASK